MTTWTAIDPRFLIVISATCIIFITLFTIYSDKSMANPWKYILLQNITNIRSDSLLLCIHEVKNISDTFNLTLSERHPLKDRILMKKSSNSSENHSLFSLHPFGVRNKTFVPDICVTFLSCRRIHLLRRSVHAIIHYFAKVEPDVTYEIALLDNGSDRDTVNEILNNFPIDILILRQTNVGIAEGLDTLFHGACRSPFILSLEDDWEARFGTWSLNLPVMAMSMHVLRSDTCILEIWLRDWENGAYYFRNRTEWLEAPAHPNVISGQRILYRRLGKSLNRSWAGYTNGASLKHRDRLVSIGYMKVHSDSMIIDFDGEHRYAERALNIGYNTAHLCLPMLHPQLRCDLVPKDKEPYLMLGLFEHLGWNARSPGRNDFITNSKVVG